MGDLLQCRLRDWEKEMIGCRRPIVTQWYEKGNDGYLHRVGNGEKQQR